MKRLLIPFLAVLVVGAAAPAASADYELSITADDGGTLRVQPGDESSIAIDYSLFCLQPFGCSIRETVSSTNDFTEFTDNSGGLCNQNGNATSFNCPEQPNTRVIATGSADTVNGSCIGSGNSSLIFSGLGGNDEVNAISCDGSEIDLGDGADFARASGSIAGGDGNDDLTGGVGNDVLDGGAGRDTIAGQGGDDTLLGGTGRDLLLPGTGNGAVEGGPEADTVSYEDRDGSQSISASLDNAPNDGAPGETGRIASDVENVIGSPAGDTIVGDDNPNDIEGGDGGDVIDPRGSADFVDAGLGNDRITARDGVPDRLECGEGNDQAITDDFDTTTNCEDVQASRELMPDVDADGVPAPADCDDRNALRRPGFIDKPGNGVDEDCLGGDAPFARIFSPVQSTFTVRGRRTRVQRLRVLAVPEGGTIELRCKGGRKRNCFKGVRRFRAPRGAEARNIRKPLRKRRLKPRARIEVRVLAPDSIGRVVRLTTRRGKLPKSRTRCLLPGENRPQRRC